MELKEFISTGIIESYLLGTASQQDIALVHDMLQKHPYLKIEMDAVEETLLRIAESKKRIMSEGLKEKIFAAINFEQPNAIKDPEIIKPTKIVSIGNNNTKMYLRYGIAASIGLLIISTVLNITMFSNNKNISNQLAQLSKDNTYMRSEMQSQKEALDKMNSQFAALTDPNNRIIPLKGLDNSPGSLATVYWNDRSNAVYLYVNNLPDAPTDQQYQLWAIVDGKPVDAGVFNTGDQKTLQTMKFASAPQAFAVTMEKKGGSPTPTLSSMCLLGEV